MYSVGEQKPGGFSSGGKQGQRRKGAEIQKTRILTILGSPHDQNSNTRVLVDDFVEELAGMVQQGKKPPISSLQKKIFKVILDKMSDVNLFRYLADRDSKSDIAPGFLKLKMMKILLGKTGFGEADVERISRMLEFADYRGLLMNPSSRITILSSVKNSASDGLSRNGVTSLLISFQLTVLNFSFSSRATSMERTRSLFHPV